jgi:hypothetical protein
MSFQTDSGPSPVCGLDSNNNPIPVIPLSGTWDYTTANYSDSDTLFTIACNTTALGKCAMWGYRPWDTAYEGATLRSLQEWHQACVRLVRADYCGDGTPHTVTGTSINVWDVLGIQTQASTSWMREAEWTQGGALCIDHTRWTEAGNPGIDTDIDYIWNNCPERLSVNDTTGTCPLWTSDESTQCWQPSDCSGGQVCIDGYCSNAPSGAAIGASCVSNSDCASNSCVSSVCADPSDFTTAVGASVDLSVRRLIRNESDYNQD